jgi:hypothetical protein
MKENIQLFMYMFILALILLQDILKINCSTAITIGLFYFLYTIASELVRINKK